LIAIKFDLNQIKYSRKIFKNLAEKYSKILIAIKFDLNQIKYSRKIFKNFDCNQI